MMSELYMPARNSEKLAQEAVIATAVKAVLDKHGEEEMFVDKELAEQLEEELNMLLPDVAQAVVFWNEEDGKAQPMIITNDHDALSEKMRAVGLWLVDSFRWSIENEGWG